MLASDTQDHNPPASAQAHHPVAGAVVLAVGDWSTSTAKWGLSREALARQSAEQ